MTMAEQFDTTIKQPLLQMKKEVESLNIEGLDVNQRLEFARAEQALKYIENYINVLNPDLLPQNFYNEIQSKIQSWNTPNDIPISTLNSILDEILFYLASYGIHIPKNQDSAIISEIIKAYGDTIKQFLQEINFNKIKKDAQSIENYEHTLLSAEDSIQKQITNSHAQIQTWFNEAQSFNSDFSAKKAEIEKARNETINISQQAQDKFSEFEKTKQNINILEQEVKNKQNELDEYDKEQKDTIEALKQELQNLLDSATLKIEEKNKEINNLLATATDASLAYSYAEAKKSYDSSIKWWTVAFISSMLGILGIAIWAFVEVADRLEPLVVLGAILIRLPLYIPLAWLAIFATRRRNEIKRLQEEYRHKEAAAKSYFGYREQIQDIEKDKDKKELMEKLMEKLVEMTNENPNKALDKIKKENNPMLELGEKTLTSIKNIIK